MTQQYRVGEFSLLLAQLHAAATTPAVRDRMAMLRRQVELLPPTALSPALAGAMTLADASCWESLTHGDTAAFTCQAEVSAELYEFGVCSGLLGRSPALIDRRWSA
ncbi:hypothetical protein SIM91_03730 [Rhodococcus opacus]|uniref:hypothetical protein n=1 Tax=Rhodococcus opacus TaxID=37919 RepID=UPI000A432CB0|nr:hypothetical protein [Rhodococcus opacus]MDX5962451.1 hypothetical protein [Rhodococcus opacus]CAG7639897.1 hypothetical protein E143388_08134 [Rhodococcus opacus]